ncbi:hypothetical protein ACQZV8_08560 [Magnetococcales bacterium HHB-1]
MKAQVQSVIKGLDEELNAGEREGAALFRYWFVQYNPLYLFSALFALSGLFLITLNMHEVARDDFYLANFAFMGAIQLYEFLLILGALFLVRIVKQQRPAILLALLEMLFLLDCSFRLENVHHLGDAGRWVPLLWSFLVFCKVALLLWVFKIKPKKGFWLFLFLITLGIAGLTPLTSKFSFLELQPILWLMHTFGLFAAYHFRRLDLWVNVDGLNTVWSRLVFKRVVAGCGYLWSGFFFYHLWNYILWLGPEGLFLPAIASVALLMALAKDDRREVLAFLAGAIFLTLPTSPLLIYVIAAVGIVFLLKIWQKLDDIYAIMAVMAFYMVILLSLSGGDFPLISIPFFSWPNALVALALGGIAWIMRSKLAAFLLVVMLAYFPHWEELLPETMLGWGVFLFGSGFVFLLAGLAVNFFLRGTSEEPPSTTKPPEKKMPEDMEPEKKVQEEKIQEKEDQDVVFLGLEKEPEKTVDGEGGK